MSIHKSDVSKRKRRNVSTKSRISYFIKNYKKIIVGIIIIVVVICGLFVGFQSGFFSNIKNNEEEYSIVEITGLKTLSEFNGVNNYTEESYFSEGDEIIVYQEYTNISHKDKADFSLYISVTNPENSNEYYTKQDLHINNPEEKGSYWSFSVDESWPAGVYLVSLELEDHISGHIANDFAVFFIED